uniref:pentapeptide repeat-containing protein n=1 Tax=Candidatus Electronema sp. TaxID=2698783 RepID=UPI004057C80C
MANKRQLAILKQGVAAWNKWREENPEVKINLRGANLEEENLSGANFSKADIRSVNFRNAVLTWANFKMARTGSTFHKKCLQNLLFLIELSALILLPILCLISLIALLLLFLILLFADVKFQDGDMTLFLIAISYIYIYNFYINPEKIENKLKSFYLGSDFTCSNLTGSNFNQSILEDARFDKAVMISTRWNDAEYLQNVSCKDTILADRDVRKLLISGKGEGLSFKGKNLRGAYLVDADLRRADLRGTDLMRANLSKANITGAKLWGSKREDWIIDGIHCDYAYLDEAGEIRTNFHPGEFEALCKQNFTENSVRMLNASLGMFKQSGGAVIMGDQYQIYGGQIAAVGKNASVSGNTFQQITADLSRLHEEMQSSAKTPEQRAAAEDVAKAAQAASEQNEPAMLQHLKNAGKFALDFAKTVGTDVAADILKKVAGL